MGLKFKGVTTMSATQGNNLFVGLADTPTDYAGASGKTLRVNLNGDGVEFDDPTGDYDLRYLQTATGGTVYGAINGVTPTSAAHLTRKDYVDTMTAANSQLLDSLDSTQFLRSDTTDSYANGILTVNNTAGRKISSNLQENTIQYFQPTTGSDAFMSFHVSGDYAIHFGLDGTTNDLAVGGWSMGVVKHKIWHAGNDGAGSGLDADLLDGLSSASFIKTTGGTATGAINGVTPTAAAHLTRKDYVDARTPTTVNSVGSYAWLGRAQTGYPVGSLVAGSQLEYTGLIQYGAPDGAATSGGTSGTGYISGTWRAMGFGAGKAGYFPCCLFLRIS